MQTAMSMTDNTELEKPKHPGGRPSKYNTRTLRNTKEYIASNTDVVPTIAGLARHLNVTRFSIYHWINNNIDEEFSNTVSMMADERERRLLNGSLKGDYNSNIAKLILTTSHGYTESKDNQAGITVNVNRSAAISHTDQTLTIDVED